MVCFLHGREGGTQTRDGVDGNVTIIECDFKGSGVSGLYSVLENRCILINQTLKRSLKVTEILNGWCGFGIQPFGVDGMRRLCRRFFSSAPETPPNMNDLNFSLTLQAVQII